MSLSLVLVIPQPRCGISAQSDVCRHLWAMNPISTPFSSFPMVTRLQQALTTLLAACLICVPIVNWVFTHMSPSCVVSHPLGSLLRVAYCLVAMMITIAMSGTRSSAKEWAYYLPTIIECLAWALLEMVWPCVQAVGILRSRSGPSKSCNSTQQQQQQKLDFDTLAPTP